MKTKTKRILIALGGTVLGISLARALNKNQGIGLAIGSAVGQIIANELYDRK